VYLRATSGIVFCGLFRIAAIWLVALAAFDLYFLDGKYIHTVEAVVRSVVHMMVG